MIKIKQIYKETYLEFEKENNVNPLQSYWWGEIKSPNWEPKRLGIYIKEDLVEVVTILLKKIPLLNKRFGYIPRSTILSQSKKIIKKLYEYGAKLNLSHILIDTETYFKEEKLKNINSLEEYGEQLQPNRTVICDLEKSENELLADMKSKHRQYIRKAVKNGIEVREGDFEDIDILCKIMRGIVDRKGYIMHDCKYYKSIFKKYSQSDKVKIFVAEKDKSPHCAHLVLLSKEGSFEMYGGCNKRGYHSKAGYLLKWESIKSMKKDGKKYYDQWGAELKYPGLVRYKEGFGGKVIDYPNQRIFIYSSFSLRAFRLMDNLNRLRQKIL